MLRIAIMGAGRMGSLIRATAEAARDDAGGARFQVVAQVGYDPAEAARAVGIELQPLLRPVYRDGAARPHERVVDIGQDHEQAAGQHLERRAEVYRAQVRQTGQAGADRLPRRIEQPGTERLQEPCAPVARRAPADREVHRLRTAPHRVREKLPHAPGRGAQGGLVRARGVFDARRLRHLDDGDRPVRTVRADIAGVNGLAERTRDLEGARHAPQRRRDGVEGALSPVRDGQAPHLRARAYVQDAPGDVALGRGARQGVLEGVHGQQDPRGGSRAGSGRGAVRGGGGVRLDGGRLRGAALARGAQGSEELPELGRALLLQHAGAHRERMVEPAVAAQVVQGPDRPALGVARAVHAAVDTGVDHEPGAHGARFERDVDGASGEAPAAEGAGGGEHGGELGMRRGVLVVLAQVVGAGDDLPVVHDHRADRHLAQLGGAGGLGQRLAHEALVGPASIHVVLPPSHAIGFDAIITSHGEMAERLNAAVLKTVERASVPRVRIPLSPPVTPSTR